MTTTSFKTLLWREYWENRSVLFVPSGITTVFLVATLLGMIGFGSFQINIEDINIKIDNEIAALTDSDKDEFKEAMPKVGNALMLLIALGQFFTIFFYFLSSLYDERRDKSILFWKSMPISDVETVLSKVTTGFLVTPIIAAAVTVILHTLTIALISIFTAFFSGEIAGLIISNSSLLTAGLQNFVSLFSMVFWLAPIFGWVIFVSAVAKRGAFLIAFFGPLAIMLIEAVIINESYFAQLIGEQFAGYAMGISDLISDQQTANFLTEGRVWVGLVITAAFIASAIYIRRYRDDSY